jgi:hypothetical protein
VIRVDYDFNPSEPQYPQTLDWSCSACSLAWLNRAMGIQLAQDEYAAVDYIGDPQNINSTYGLMDASGGRLRDCLREQGVAAVNGWWTWDQAAQLATGMGLLIGGVGWNHWVGVRKFDGVQLQIANSAQGWMGVYTTLSAGQWNSLGPFAVVAAPRHVAFPPV